MWLNSVFYCLRVGRLAQVLLLAAILLGFQLQMNPALARQTEIGDTGFVLADKLVKTSNCVDLGKRFNPRWLCGPEKIMLFDATKITDNDRKGRYCNTFHSYILCLDRTSNFNIYYGRLESLDAGNYKYDTNNCALLREFGAPHAFCVKRKLYGDNEWYWLMDIQIRIDGIRKDLDQSIKDNSARDAQSDTAIRQLIREREQQSAVRSAAMVEVELDELRDALAALRSEVVALRAEVLECRP